MPAPKLRSVLGYSILFTAFPDSDTEIPETVTSLGGRKLVPE